VEGTPTTTAAVAAPTPTTATPAATQVPGTAGTTATCPDSRAERIPSTPARGCVFLLQGEPGPRKQWRQLIDSLELFVGEEYPEVSRYFGCLFDLSNPAIPDVPFPTIRAPPALLPLPAGAGAAAQAQRANDVAAHQRVAEIMEKKQIEVYMSQLDNLATSLRAFFRVIVGQCSEAVRGRLLEQPNYVANRDDSSVSSPTWTTRRARTCPCSSP